MLAALVCGASVAGRQPFGVLGSSLLAYIGPLAFMRIVLDPLPMGLVNAMRHMACYSMPLSFPGTFMEAPPGGKAILVGIALAVAAFAMARGAYRYCRRQVGQ